jgi:hypothetical protein
MKTLTLPNRDGILVELVPIKRGLYQLKFDANTVRIGSNEDGSINFVDPPGGPFINIGYKINRDKAVSRIYREDGIKIEVK